MEKTSGQWFDVSREGLRELQDGKPKHFIARELIQNAWDEESRTSVSAVWNSGIATITVSDDSPEGFRDITHAFTLFAPTYKRNDPEKRGRFNLGEKQALAVCETAKISTTKGTIIFNREGRTELNQKTRAGSVIEVSFKCLKAEFEELLKTIKSYLPPKGLEYSVNGEIIKYQIPFRVTNVDLPTVVQIDNALRPTHRKTDVYVITCEGNGTLFEMGIPVCEIDCDYSIDIQQKIPLTPDRESVTDSYLAKLFAHVFNAVHDQLPEGSASRSWVRIAVGHPIISVDAIKTWSKRIYGDKVLIATASDKNSIDEAISKGYKIIYGPELSSNIWDNIKRTREEEKGNGGSFMQTTGAVFGVSATSGASQSEVSEGMEAVARLAKNIALRFLGLTIRVEFKEWAGNIEAQFGGDCLTFNVKNRGHEWFDNPLRADVLDLILHEIAHSGGNHTEHSYHETLTKLAGELIMTALNEPTWFAVQIEKHVEA